jgi:hypothetical protein
MRDSGSSASTNTVFDELFGEHSEGQVEHLAIQQMNRLLSAQKRVRRILDRGVPRSQGAVLKKSVSALVVARDVLEKLGATAAKQGSHR